MRTRWSILTALLILSAPVVAGTNPLAVRVSPTKALAPADVLVCAVVERDANNRALAVEIESLDFFSSSSAELEGDSARRVNDFVFRALPAGEYEVRVTLYDAAGRPRGTISRTVSIV